MNDTAGHLVLAELFTSGGEPCEKCGDLNSVGVSIEVAGDDSTWQRDLILCETHFASFVHVFIFGRLAITPEEWGKTAPEVG